MTKGFYMAIRKHLSALVICLLTVFALGGLLPATALAAAPNGQVIYVGNVNVTSGGYWTTGNDGTVTAFTGEGTPADNFIHYDATNNVLTLHNAAIKKGLDYSESIQGGTYIPGSAIGVFHQNGAAELTIQLEGTNTIAEVSTGIYVLAFSNSTGDASLTITGSGSLDTSGSYNPAIRVQSNGGNATLSIENAKVTATASSSGDGVLVQSKNDSSVSLTVDGGSLTATGSGNYGAGIQLLFGSGDSGSGTPTVTVSNNAIVRANSGISDNSSADIQIGADSSGNNGGIVWDGKEGTVYGSVELQDDLEIGEDESLIILDGSRLTIPNDMTLTNKGKVKAESGGALTNNGTIINYGMLPSDINGDGKINHIPTYTFNHPESLTLTENSSGFYTAKGTLSLGDNSVLAGNGKVVVYGTNQAQFNTLTLSNNEDETQTIPFNFGTRQEQASAYFQNPNETKILAVLENKDECALEVLCEKSAIQNVSSGSYNGTLKLYVGYSTDENIKVGDKANEADLKQLTPYEITVKLEVPAHTEPIYNISASPSTLNFSNMTEGYQTAPTTQTVTITNTGNQTITLNQPTATNFKIGTLSKTELAAGETATFTVQPIMELAVGNYNETLTISGSNNTSTSISCSVTVTHGNMVHTPKKAATCTADGNKEYWMCETCGKYFSDADGETEIKLEDTVIPVTNHNYKDGKCTVCRDADPNYQEPTSPTKDEPAAEDSTKSTKDKSATKSSTPQTSDALFGYAVFFVAIIILASIVSVVAYRKLHTVQAKHSSSNKH